MRTRAAASVVLAIMVLLGTTACNFLAPQATGDDYDPSNGVSATVGDIKVLNAVILSEDGDEGSFLASIVNTGTENIRVKLQYESAGGRVDARLTVEAGEFASLGTEDGIPLILEDIDTAPGALFPVFVQYDDYTGKQMLVPVLAGWADEYDGLMP